MPANTKSITYQLSAAAATGISTSASVNAGVSSVLNGSLVTAGVATLDTHPNTARRVIVTPAADESTNTFTITGTDRYGRPQVEALKGVANPTVAQSSKDFLTVTKVVPTNNTAGAITVGTSSVGSSDAYIADWIANPNVIGAALVIGAGTVNATIQESYDDLAPAWDQANNTVTWFNDANLASKAANSNGTLAGPFTMIRLLINSGTDPVTLKLIVPFNGGRI